VKTRFCIVMSSPSTVRSLLCGLIRYLSGSYDVMVAANCAPVELRAIVPSGVSCLSVPIARRTLGVSDLRSVLTLGCVFRRERIDIVHSYTPKAGLVAMVAVWIARVPLWFPTFTGQLRHTRRGFMRLVLKGRDVLIAKLATDVLADSAFQFSFLRREDVFRSDRGRVLGPGSVRDIDLAYVVTNTIGLEEWLVRRRSRLLAPQEIWALGAALSEILSTGIPVWE